MTSRRKQPQIKAISPCWRQSVRTPWSNSWWESSVWACSSYWSVSSAGKQASRTNFAAPSGDLPRRIRCDRPRKYPWTKSSYLSLCNSFDVSINHRVVREYYLKSIRLRRPVTSQSFPQGGNLTQQQCGASSVGIWWRFAKQTLLARGMRTSHKNICTYATDKHT